MSAYSDHASQLAALQAELGGDCPTFTWNSAPWQILPGGAKFKRANDPGGFELTADLTLTVLAAQFNGALPDSGDQITYLGRTYIIVNLTTAPAGYQLRIEANLLTQGL